MSKVRVTSTQGEQLIAIKDRFLKEHPGPFHARDVIAYAVTNGLADLPKTNPLRILEGQLKRALRASRIRDAQGRTVREMVAAKMDRVDENGNMVIDVVWDHLHTMSLDHALQSFDQRDENISKQRRSATRDVQSCLENNPNLKGHEQLFLFDFALEDEEAQVVEEIAETPKAPKPR